MTDDRAEFTANRDAGLVKRHEQRLARAREGIEFPADGVERTAYLEGEPVTDMVIPPAALEAAVAVLGSALAGNYPALDLVAEEMLAAALPHLRPMLELAGNLGRELGRREAAEEIAAALGQCRDLHWTHRELAARIAREIATREPK